MCACCDRKDASIVDKNSERASVPLAERQVCTSVCVEDDTPIVQMVVAKKMACAPCVLPETVRDIALALVEEKVVCAAVMHNVAGVVDEGMVDVPAEIDDFTAGVTEGNAFARGYCCGSFG